MNDELRDNGARRGATKSSDTQLSSAILAKDQFPPGFEEDDDLRSEFIRQLGKSSLRSQYFPSAGHATNCAYPAIPRTLIRFWHDSQRVPTDVQACLDSWAPLRRENVTFVMFDDRLAARYIAWRYGSPQAAAFSRCAHPAMRSDYLRLCFILAEGGLYVDADDVLLNEGWRRVFGDNRLKLQPLCYDISRSSMVATAEEGLYDRPSPERIFYFNNNPIAAPPGHPVLRRALDRATRILLDSTVVPEIQSATGPGNLTAAIAAHIHEDLLGVEDPSLMLDLLFDWEMTAEPDWQLQYRRDDRNWRNWSLIRPLDELDVDEPN